MQIHSDIVRLPALRWPTLRSSVTAVLAAAALTTLPLVSEARRPADQRPGAENAQAQAEIAARGDAFSRAYIA